MLKMKRDDIFGAKAQFILKSNTRWLKPTAMDSASNKQFSRSILYPLPFTLVNGLELKREPSARKIFLKYKPYSGRNGAGCQKK